MKFIYIAILVFCIQVGSLLTNQFLDDTVGLTPGKEREMDKGFISKINDTSYEYSPSAPGDDSGAFLTEIKQFLSTAWNFIKVIGVGVFIVPTTIHNFGVNWTYSILIGLPVQLMYIIGIFQIFTKQTWEAST